MASASHKKRGADDVVRPRQGRPSKKQKRQREYHSDSDEVDAADDFQAVDLLDSDDEDLDNVEVDDVASQPSDSGSDASSGSGAEARSRRPKKQPQTTRQAPEIARDAPPSEDESDESDDARGSGSDDDGGGDDDDDDDDDDEEEIDLEATSDRRRAKSKRNDPAAFATSLSKILSTKLSSSRRADPVLARSAAAAESSRQALDAALEAKARRRLRDQKRLALEKGRVRDVLVATTTTTSSTAPLQDTEAADAEAATTAQILATERRLRKIAQRGVVKLFNAVRTAQVKAMEAERLARNEGITGVKRRQEKVAEMSKKGFLDLIASGGGGLKKGPLEEA